MKTVQLNILQELQKEEHYHEVMNKIQSKMSTSSWKKKSAPGLSDINLEQILFNKNKIIPLIIQSLKKEEYTPNIVKKISIYADKKREIYQFEWTDKIIQMTLAKILSQSYEQYWNTRVFSFRKKRSAILLLSEISQYIKLNKSPFFIRADISSYGENIDQALLNKKIKESLVPQSEYIYNLFDNFISPKYLDKNLQEQILKKGIPTGTPLVPFYENLYLTCIDDELTKNSDVFYGRYGDDFMIAHKDQSVMSRVEKTFLKQVDELNLHMSKDKFSTGQLGKNEQCIKYLGLNVYNDSTVSLTKDKDKRFKNIIRSITKESYRNLYKNTSNKEVCIKHIIFNLNLFLKEPTLVPYLAYFSMPEYNAQKLKDLDRWIAKQTLRPIFKTAHDRVFRYVSLKKIRKWGLVSIQNTRHARIRRKTQDAT